MSIKSNTNELTDKLEMVFTSGGVALSAAGMVHPFAGLLGLVANIAALPFASYNSSLIRKQLDVIIDEFNKLDTRVEKIEALNEKQKDILLLNEYKFFDYCLKEKMREKIQAYAKILSQGINSGTIIEENDLFDIQMDIINSLRIEDILLINQIYGFMDRYNLVPYSSKFKKSDLEAYVFGTTGKKSLNEYAFRHLINLGLLLEITSGSLPNVVGEKISFSDNLIFKYVLTQRCKMIYDVIVGL